MRSRTIETTKETQRMEKWLQTEFISSSVQTKQFKNFSRDYKKTIKSLLPDHMKITDYSRGHFFVSGFIQNQKNDNFVFFSVSDVRFFTNDWYNNVMCRTAEHNKDFTGGQNYYCTLDQLGNLVSGLGE